MVRLLKNNRGQTAVEYLLLTGAAAITVIFILPKFGEFTVSTINEIRDRLGSVVKNGELSKDTKEPGQKGHPGNPDRFKPLHF